MTKEQRSAIDQGLRRLRFLYALVFLGLIVFIVMDGQPDNPATFGTLVGAAVVVLGLEVGVRLPSLGPVVKDEKKGDSE